MSGSRHYLAALKALHELFVNYPVRAKMSSIHIATDSTGRISILAYLDKTDPVVSAAGTVEWTRTLTKSKSWAWRTPNSNEFYVATVGYAPECAEMQIAVLAGPVPHDCYLDFDLEPDFSEELSANVVYRWLGDEIANNWPFEPLPTGWNQLTTHTGAKL
ncbi:hypothetical protein [Actinophytocola sediminis]